MGQKRITYKVTAKPNTTIDLVEMLRYSRGRVLKIESKNPLSLLLEHMIWYENDEHLKRQIKHFEGQILPRWKSFGFLVERGEG